MVHRSVLKSMSPQPWRKTGCERMNRGTHAGLDSTATLRKDRQNCAIYRVRRLRRIESFEAVGGGSVRLATLICLAFSSAPIDTHGFTPGAPGPIPQRRLT